MKKLELKIDNKFNDDNFVYTYNVINKSIENFDDFLDFLDDDLSKSDLSKIDLDKYRDYIFEIIDNSDYVFMESVSTKEIELYINHLEYEYYDEITVLDWQNPVSANHLFNIKDDKSKQFVKKNLKFNLSDEYREALIVETDKEYILNDDSFDGQLFKGYIDYGFVKDNKLLIILVQYDGYIYDYRDKKVRDRQIKKYLNK